MPVAGFVSAARLMCPWFSYLAARADNLLVLWLNHAALKRIRGRRESATLHGAWCHHFELAAWHTHRSGDIHSVFVFQAVSYLLSYQFIEYELFAQNHAKQLVVGCIWGNS